MKKYNVQLLISSQGSYSFWKGLESNSEPKVINEGVIEDIREIIDFKIESM